MNPPDTSKKRESRKPKALARADPATRHFPIVTRENPTCSLQLRSKDAPAQGGAQPPTATLRAEKRGGEHDQLQQERTFLQPREISQTFKVPHQTSGRGKTLGLFFKFRILIRSLGRGTLAGFAPRPMLQLCTAPCTEPGTTLSASTATSTPEDFPAPSNKSHVSKATQEPTALLEPAVAFALH